MSDQRICALIQETRRADGFVNATVWCTKYGRLFAHFSHRAGTRKYIDAVDRRLGIQSVESRPRVGTYVHPIIFVELLRWLDRDLVIFLVDRLVSVLPSAEQSQK